MKIKTQFINSMVIFGIILIIIATSVIVTNQQVERLNKQEEIAKNIERDASELGYLSNDYLLYHESPQRARWESKFSELSDDLSNLNPNSPEQQTLVNNIRANQQRLKAVFTDVASTFENTSQDADPALFQISWSRMAVQNQGMAFDAARLSQMLRDQADQLKQTNITLISALLVILGLYFLTNYLIVYRRALRSISELQDGTRIIGSGNFDFAIKQKNDDEIGELSHAFNRMTANLKNVTASKTELEREITERKRAEEALRESEQRWATTLSSIGDAVISTDIEGRITFMNAVAEALTGWTLADASTRPVTEVFNIINEYTRREADNPVSRVLQEGAVVGLANHTILVRKDGTEIPIDDSGAPIRDGDGRTMGVVLVFRDITERKQAEEALRSAEAKFRILVEQSLVGIYITQDKKIIYVNPKLAEMLGYTQDEITSSTSVSDLIVEEDSDRAIENIRKRLRGEVQSVQQTFRGKRKDGTLIDLEVHGTRTELDGKTVVIGVALDITERKRTEEALRESEQRLRRFYESGLVGVMYWNMNGAITDANDKFLEMVGYTREELAAGKIDWANMTPPEYRHLDEHSVAELKATGINKMPFEKEYICKDGTCIPIIVAGAMLDEARFNGVAFVLDITERKKAEEALKESEQRWATTLASIGDAVISTDVEGRITFINAEAEALTGWTLAEASTRPVAEVFNVINEYTRKEADNPVTRVLQEGTIVGLANHTILVRKDGTEVPIDDSGAPIREPDGKTMGVVLVFRDITERKRAEEALARSSRRISEILESITDGFMAIDNGWRFTYVNQRAADNLGLKPEELIGQNIWEKFPTIKDTDHEIYYREAMQQHELQYFEMHGVLTDKWYGIRVYPSAEGISVFWQDITERKRAEGELRKAHDELEARVKERTAELEDTNKALQAEITERKRAEEALIENEQRYRELTESINDLFYAMDGELKYTYWNKASEALTGILAKDAIGKSLLEVFPDIKKTKVEQFYIEALKTQQPQRFESEYQLGEKKFTFDVNAYPTKIGLSVIAKDITEKKMLEAQLLRAQRMESIGTLAGGIAHDLNNMLTPIMMSLQMFKEKYKDEQSQKLLTILENNSQRSADLVKQVLSFARGVEGERNPLAAKHIITEIEKISKETFPRNIEIRTDIPKDLYTILGDATQLHQVIMNLCVNSRDAMPDGGNLNITASNFFIDENYSRMHTEAKIGSYIVIEVSDTGTGIPPKILDRIFEPFFTTKEFGKGTGLGLSTVLAIVKSHGGFINVNSEVGKGTTFGVYLPAIKTEIQSIDEKQPELFIGHGELVLVAEDEDSVREVTISTLEKNGYRVLTASDGVEAISSYAQNMEEIKIILMDMMMPVMDGHASIRAIRRINPQVKIIAASGLAEKEKLKNIADNTNAFLPKPYTAEKLLKIIHEVLNAK